MRVLLVEQSALALESVRAPHIAVIGREHDDRRVEHSEIDQLLQDDHEVVIAVLDAIPVVVLKAFPARFRRDRTGLSVHEAFEDREGVRKPVVADVLGPRRREIRSVRLFVHFSVGSLADRNGTDPRIVVVEIHDVVRVDQIDREEERLPFGVLRDTGSLQPFERMTHDLRILLVPLPHLSDVVAGNIPVGETIFSEVGQFVLDVGDRARVGHVPLALVGSVISGRSHHVADRRHVLGKRFLPVEIRVVDHQRVGDMFSGVDHRTGGG